MKHCQKKKKKKSQKAYRESRDGSIGKTDDDVNGNQNWAFKT
jgi:hypothetical protein